MSELSASKQAPHFDPAVYTGAVSDGLTIKRVYGEAYDTPAGTVIPVAKVIGGALAFGGYGSGHGPLSGTGEETGGGSGSGGGGTLGLRVKPLGAYVVRGEDIRWVPTIDVNRIALTALAGLTVAIVATVAGTALVKRKRGLLF